MADAELAKSVEQIFGQVHGAMRTPDVGAINLSERKGSIAPCGTILQRPDRRCESHLRSRESREPLRL
jgi:hypothetical protein